MNLYRIRCLLVKEFNQLRRDRKIFGILLITPVIQLIVFGLAATTDLREVSLAVRDQDHSHLSREYVRALASSGYFQTRMLEGPEKRDGDLLVAGDAGLVLVIPVDFGKTLVANRPASVQVLVDGSDSNFGVQGLNYLQKATRLFSERLVRVEMRRLQQVRGDVELSTVTVESRAWYNPDLRSRFYMLPGIMGVLLLVTTMIVTSMALVKEREEGTMEQLIVTPLSPGELVAGKLLPFAIIGLVEVTLCLPVILFVFDVPLHGNVLYIYVSSALFLMTTLGLGLLISTMVHTQQQAMLVASFFVMMPFVLLSGFIFPVETMPWGIRWVTYFIPLRYYLAIIRGVFLKGAGPAVLWPQGLVLLVWGTGILALATRKFHKRLD